MMKGQLVTIEEDWEHILCLPSEQIGAWYTSQHHQDPLDEELEFYGEILSTVEKTREQCYTGEDDARLQAIVDRRDAQRAFQEIEDAIAAGHASLTLLECFRNHCWTEAFGIAIHANSFPTELTWPLDLPAKLRRHIESIDVEVVDSLGNDVILAILRGPVRTRLAIAEHAFYDAQELMFTVFRATLHSFVEIRPRRFGVLLEYRRDAEIPVLENERYRDVQARAAVEATALTYPEYLDEETTRDLLSRARRQLLGIFPKIQPGHLPAIGKFFRLFVWGALTPENIGALISRTTRQRIAFGDHLAVVRNGWWGRIYLIWADPHGVKKRRWIVSRTILELLGLNLADVVDVGRDLLNEYEYEGILIDPDSVATVRDAINKTAKRAFTLGEWPTRVRLKGLQHNSSPLALAQEEDPHMEAVSALGITMPSSANEGAKIVAMRARDGEGESQS